MKKQRLFMFLGGICLALSLVALPFMAPCAKSAPAPPASVPDPFTLCGGAAGSSKHMQNELIAQLLRTKLGWRAYVLVGPTSMGEASLMADGKLHASCDNFLTPFRATTEGTIAGVPLAKPVKISVVIPATLSKTLLYLKKDYPAKSISEIIKKKHRIKLAVGRKGTGPGETAPLVFKAYGASAKDIEGWGGKILWVTGRRGADMIGDGLVDGVLYTSSTPYSAFAKLAKVRSLKALTVTEPDAVKKLREMGFIPAVVPTGTYDFMPKPQPTVGVPHVWYVPRDLDEQVVYQMAKVMWENRESLMKSSPSHFHFRDVKTITEWLKSIDKVEMLHPGAAKYWREQGMLK